MTENNRLDDERNKRIAWQAQEDRLQEIARREAEKVKQEAIEACKKLINEFSLKVIGVDWTAPILSIDPKQLLTYIAEERARDEARRKWWGTTAMAVLGACGMAVLSLVVPIMLRKLGIS